MGILLYIIYCFFLDAFSIFSLPLFFFCQYHRYVSWHIIPWVNPILNSLCFLFLSYSFLSYIREFFSYFLFRHFPRYFSFCYPVGPPIMPMLVCLVLFQKSLKLSSFFILHYSIPRQSFPPLFSQLTYPFFCLIYSIIDSIVLISIIVFTLLFFIFSNSLLKFPLNFLLCSSILFLHSWIIFIFITLNYFLGRLPIYP